MTPLEKSAYLDQPVTNARKPLIGITLDSVNPEQQEHAAAYSYELWYALRYRYTETICSAGGVPLPLPHHIGLIPDFVDTLDGLLITGGGFDVDPKLYGATTTHSSVFLKPSRTSFEHALCQAFFEAKKPILGICGGMQLINVVLGGTLHQHVPDLEGVTHTTNDGASARLDHQPPFKPFNTAHDIHIRPNTLLSTLSPLPIMPVNSVHHQAVERLATCLTPSAYAEDGILEAFEYPDYPFLLGIQWHPEFLLHSLDQNIFNSFIKKAIK